MNPTNSGRAPNRGGWTAAAGIGFAVLFLYALLGPPRPPDGAAPNEVWRAHLANSGNRLGLLASTIAAVASGLLFLGFMAGLRRDRTLPAESGRGPLGYGAGLLFVMSVFAAFCAWVAVPAGIQISGEPQPSGELIRYLNDLGQAFLAIPAPLCAGAFVLSLTVGAGHTEMPRWLAATGWGVGIVQVAGILFFPMLLFPIWVALLAAVRPARRAALRHQARVPADA